MDSVGRYLKNKMEKDRFNIISEAIEAERAAEEAYYSKLLKGRTNTQKVDDGVAWYPVIIINKYYSVGEYIEVEVERTKALDQCHKLKVGVGCQLFRSEDNIKEFFPGVVSFLRRNIMKVLLRSEYLDLDDLKNTGNLGVEMVYDERPYQVMQQAIMDITNTCDPAIIALREGIRNRENLNLTTSPIRKISQRYRLNDSQVEAVEGAMNAAQMAIIHGPPGTGKTTTLVALVRELIQFEKRILVCAPSNNAVDLLAKQLDQQGIKVLRIGNVSRIDDNITHLTVEEKVRRHGDWLHIKKVKIQAEDARKTAGKYKRSFGHSERIERNNMYKEAKELKRWAEELENRLIGDILKGAEVILSTLVGISSRYMESLFFNTVIIDEASQTLEPECWNAILKGKRVIMAGDHKQLPPTVKSPEAIKAGLEITLLDRMTDRIKHSYLLKVQYRMNDYILAFSNTQFYNSALISAQEVKMRTVPGDTGEICFIDTAGTGFEEKINEEYRSRYNEGEYFILREHLLGIKERILGCQIGIISPYAEQVRYIRDRITEDEDFKGLDLQIDSIDGFQGQEKDIIYISFVRSNDAGETGFVKDARRLNVAMTRARKKLIMIGDSATLGTDPLYERLLEHVEKKGVYSSAWEYMS